MSSRCSSPAPSDSSQSSVVQVFPADFIHAQKLSGRLDRLLGPNGYTCYWQLNKYFLDSWRPLNDVSGLALRLLLLSTRLLLPGLCNTDLPTKGRDRRPPYVIPRPGFAYEGAMFATVEQYATNKSFRKVTRFRKGLYTEVETIGFGGSYGMTRRVLTMILDIMNSSLAELKLDRWNITNLGDEFNLRKLMTEA
jgi:hypothetical protein